MADELLFPATDAGALFQLAIAVVVTMGLGFVLRRHRERQLFAVGVGICTVGLMALRVIH